MSKVEVSAFAAVGARTTCPDSLVKTATNDKVFVKLKTRYGCSVSNKSAMGLAGTH